MTKIPFFTQVARYHFVVATAAALLAAETYVLGNQAIDYPLLLAIFAATLGAYSFADLELCVTSYKEKKQVNIRGSKTSLFIAGTSILCFSLSTIFINSHILSLIFWITIGSLLYINPVRFNCQRLHGLRNLLFVKSLLLALIWTVTTVWMPLLEINESLFGTSQLLLFARRFIFIFSLAVLYDLRDVEIDKITNVRTFASTFGVRAAKLLSYATLGLFLAVSYTDPTLQTTTALSLSALIAMVVVFQTNTTRSDAYYRVVVDGMMIVQFLLIVLIH